jgi:hypothetical protein
MFPLPSELQEQAGLYLGPMILAFFVFWVFSVDSSTMIPPSKAAVVVETLDSVTSIPEHSLFTISPQPDKIEGFDFEGKATFSIIVFDV